MKKIFGTLVTSENPEGIFYIQESLYKKISKKFDEFFIINLINFNLFKKKKLYKNKDSNNLLPHNFKIITPINEEELNKFLVDKNLVAFMEFGKNLNNFKIQFLVKKYNIRLIYLQNTGAIGNQYLGKNFAGHRKTKIIRFYFFRLKKILTYFLLKVFIFFNLFSRIDIYFESDKSIVDNCNNSLGKKIEKIFPFLKICYFKKIVHINARPFDMLTKNKLNLSEDKIVFIDSNIESADITFREGKIDEQSKLEYFNQLSQFLLRLSNIFNKEIIICLHPKTDWDMYKKYLGKFELCKYQTSENLKKAFIVVFHESTIIADAIFLKKKIISLKSEILGEYISDRINYYEKQLGIFSYSLEENKELNKNLLQTKLENITKNYDQYINNKIASEDPTFGEDKIINTIRKEYIVNN